MIRKTPGTTEHAEYTEKNQKAITKERRKAEDHEEMRFISVSIERGNACTGLPALIFFVSAVEFFRFRFFQCIRRVRWFHGFPASPPRQS
ncbi:hypothetical protein [Natronospira bacteriovora]|uniref:Uncharacterized protein n=1 Tax=Natronospira bacteriovora TaxID=3069753 RepID=A0ABU0W6Q1_9GAMM|nr:hypothetical protein [Natronospira sp. AB-CW4]MDQ2069433.1 hypothetical protein [Natronospira sp. AB-CW4]